MANNRNLAAMRAAQLCMKKAKAFDIISSKQVTIYRIKCVDSVKAYNSMYDKSNQLTEEEFKLIKDLV